MPAYDVWTAWMRHRFEDPALSFEDSDEGPVLRLPGGSLCFTPEYAIVDGDAEPPEALLLDAMACGRAAALVAAFPMERVLDDGSRVRVEIEPAAEPSREGLSLALRITTWDAGGALEDLRQREGVFVSMATLGAGDFESLRDAWAERCDEGLRDADRRDLDAFWFDREPDEAAPPEDEGWEAFADALGLPGVLADLDAVLARVRGVLETVSDEYRRIYGLRLPRGLGHLAAVVEALGALPEDPPDALWDAPLGWERGAAWLDAALGMRPAGLLDAFPAGRLARPTRDAAAAGSPVPPGGEGPLDPRLDGRFRRDAPQLVTFLFGDGDGLHWGFWYDDPERFPRIAANWARDSAETWVEEADDVLALLERRIEQGVREIADEVRAELAADGDGPREALGRLRALGVVRQIVAAVRARVGPPEALDEPRCDWPLTDRGPIGSPRLALPPGSGEVPASVPGFGDDAADDPASLREDVSRARAALSDGRPAHALALGLYLHWRDDDALRAPAGELLVDAYRALGWAPFAEIAALHLRHRDLPHVSVFVTSEPEG